MLKLSAKVEIKGEKSWTFQKITACEIVSSLKDPADYCKITLPRKLKWKGYNEIPIRRGDKISVWLGYDDNLQLAFSGYVRSVSNGSPCILDCEDEFFNYHKTQEIEHCFSEPVKCSRFVEFLGYKGYHRDFSGADDITDVYADTPLSFTNSVYGACHYLLKMGIFTKFFWDSNLGQPVLTFFFPTDNIQSEYIVLDSAYNITDSRNLKYVHPDDAKCYVKIGSLESCYYVGSAPVFHEKVLGEQVPGAKCIIAKPEGWTKDMVERTAEFIYKFYTRGGLYGSVSCFGFDLINLSNAVAIKLNDEKMGIYNLSEVKTVYSNKGLRQHFKLGYKIDD